MNYIETILIFELCTGEEGAFGSSGGVSKATARRRGSMDTMEFCMVSYSDGY